MNLNKAYNNEFEYSLQSCVQIKFSIMSLNMLTITCLNKTYNHEFE